MQKRSKGALFCDKKLGSLIFTFRKGLSGLLVFYLWSVPLLLSGQEQTAQACSDGIDNDLDGGVDCQDEDCFQGGMNGCETCLFDGLSFADIVLGYQAGCLRLNFDDPSAALGIPDWNDPVDGHALVLGEGGWVELGFVNNVLANSGDSLADIFIFEIGAVAEQADIELRPFDKSTEEALRMAGVQDLDGDGFFPVGEIGGKSFSVDIDLEVPGFPSGALRFDAIKIIDFPDIDCESTINPGVDIDAVCALNSLVLDCKGDVNGAAVIDDCGNCKSLDDPSFNECYDCAGNWGGTAFLDACGHCISETQSIKEDCLEGIFIPNVFAPNGDGRNDYFGPYFGKKFQGKLEKLSIFDRWGNLVFQSQNPLTEWDGTWQQKKLPTGIYIYQLILTIEGDRSLLLNGEVLLLR